MGVGKLCKGGSRGDQKNKQRKKAENQDHKTINRGKPAGPAGGGLHKVTPNHKKRKEKDDVISQEKSSNNPDTKVNCTKKEMAHHD